MQLNNPGRMRKEGLGLGLAIVRRAAAQLGHTVSLESESGRGSCFKVVIPLADRSRKNANLERSERSAAIDATTLRGRVIWLVEDNDEVRDALALQLSQWGVRLESFCRAEDFRDRVLSAQDWPDLIISDARLPDGDGLELITEMRADAPIPVAALLITGNTAPDQIAKQLASGVAILHKPFGSEALLRALHEELRHSSQGTEATSS